MSGVSDTWLSRIGPQATATLERAMFLSRCGLTGCLLMIPVFCFFGLRNSGNGMDVTFIGMLVWPAAFFSRSVYLQIQARKQAGEYLHLAAGEWRWLSVRSPDRFDSWVRQHPSRP
jgi:hypothetical protein